MSTIESSVKTLNSQSSGGCTTRRPRAVSASATAAASASAIAKSTSCSGSGPPRAHAA